MAPKVELPRVLEPACDADVMREQLDYLIEHAVRAPGCGCPDCQRYLRVRSILLEIFGEPQPGKVVEIGLQLAKAA
ncbi:MAG TPA: hypothetical protein VMT86_00510 [Bryobacteraceae bacterium]|nr:hypothetical protein [Bryobacteraceae bacterium]